MEDNNLSRRTLVARNAVSLSAIIAADFGLDADRIGEVIGKVSEPALPTEDESALLRKDAATTLADVEALKEAFFPIATLDADTMACFSVHPDSDGLRIIANAFCDAANAIDDLVITEVREPRSAILASRIATVANAWAEMFDEEPEGAIIDGPDGQRPEPGTGLDYVFRIIKAAMPEATGQEICAAMLQVDRLLIRVFDPATVDGGAGQEGEGGAHN